MQSIEIITKPTTYPVSLDEAKNHIGITYPDRNDEINSMIGAATSYLENKLNRKLITQVWKSYYDTVSQVHFLPWPVISIDEILNGSTEIENYEVIKSEPAKIKFDSVPTLADTATPLAITATYGYGSSDDVPEPIKIGVKLMVSHWFNNRSAVITGTISKEIEHSLNAIVEMYRVPNRAGGLS